MNLEKLQLVKPKHIKQFMRRFELWLIVLASSFMAVEARAISATQFSHLFTTTIPFQTKQIVQASWECHGQQILQARTCPGDGLEPEEIKLYRMLNQYRAQEGLPAIPLSASLSLVANRHVRDLVENVAPSTYPHSWSNCLYARDNRDSWPCMWKAPQRLKTPYPGNGYENLFGGTGGYLANAEEALNSWRSDPPHNDVIINQGIWRHMKWNALGVGIYKAHAAIWFGEELDPVGQSKK